MCSMMSAVGDASTQELVEAASVIATELAGREAPEAGMAALQLAESLGIAIDVLEAALASLVKRVDDTGVFGELGFSSTGAWLRSRLGMRDGRAAERVRLARQLPRLKQVAQRLACGSLPAGYAGAIADAVARLDDIDAELGERLLLDLAERGHTAAQVAKDAAQITDLINTHRGKEKEPDESRRGFSRSWATKSKSLDGGLWLRAWLTPEHAAAFEQIIGPLAKPKAQGDDRDLAQRTAEALMSVITEGNKGAGVTIIIDLAAYTQATADTGPFDRTRRTGGAQTQPNPGNGRGNGPGDGDGKGPGDGDGDGPGARTGPTGTASSRPVSPDTEADPMDAGDPHNSPRGRSQPIGDGPRDSSDLISMLDDLADELDLRGMWGDPTEGPYAAQGDKRDGVIALDASLADPFAQEHSRVSVTDPAGDNSRGPEAMAGTPSDAPCRPGNDPPDPVLEHARGRVAARLLNGTPISPERARQIALNAGINVLVLGRSGLPLYLGRTVRFATPAQRKTLLALYDTCCVQGCQIPAHLSEIHHLDGGWKLGTPTDINKLVPACGWHNRWIETHPDQVEQTHDTQGRTTLKLLAPWERATTQAA